jgi:hypothetical protein
MPEAEEKPIIKLVRQLISPAPAAPPVMPLPKPTPEEIAKAETDKRRAEERKREGQGGGISMDRKVKRADDIVDDTPSARVKQ